VRRGKIAGAAVCYFALRRHEAACERTTHGVVCLTARGSLDKARRILIKGERRAANVLIERAWSERLLQA